jgi:SAM-dependent methyltransferase
MLLDHAEIFDGIYARNDWLEGSGPGSMEESTRNYRKFLQNFLKCNGIKSLLDVGCGDWQFSRHLDWTDIDYLGIDVSSIALTAAKAFAGPGIRFRHLDAATDTLPSADLVLVKDVLQHWSNAEIIAFLPKLTMFRMALITNGFNPFKLAMTNLDIATGDWRPVDLQEPPFNVRGIYVYAYFGGEPKQVFLWSNPADQ